MTEGRAGPDGWTWLDRVTPAILCVLALWLRWPGLARGYTSDELANVMVGSAWAVLTDVEAGVNPPLLRVLFNGPFHDFHTPYYGRVFSLVCSVVAVALAYAVGRRAAGDRWLPGVLAGALVALHPVAIQYATIYRIYAWWSATMLVHVWSLGHALDATEPRPRRGWGALAVGSAMLLPWIHYFSVPVLLVLGASVLVGMPGRRRWFFAYVPAALAITPMIPYVLTATARRVAPEEPLGAVVQKVSSLGLAPPMVLANPMSRLWSRVTDEIFHWPSWMSISMMALMALQLLLWRRIPATQRLVVVGALAVLGGVTALGQIQYVRDPTIIMMLVFLAPALAGSVGQLPMRYGPMLGTLVLGWWVGAQLPERMAYYADRAEELDGPPAFVADWSRWIEVASGRPILIHPAYFVPTIYFYRAEEHFGRSEWSAACKPYGVCFEEGGVVVVGVDEVGDGAGLHGLLVSFDPHRDAAFASTCAEVQLDGRLGVWDCSMPPPPEEEPVVRDPEPSD